MLSGSRHKRQETSEDSVSVWGYITKYDYGRNGGIFFQCLRKA